MEDVFQNTNIIQSRAGIGCTVPEPEMVGLSTCPQNPVIESLD